MEFSYRISEGQYSSAWKLRFKGESTFRVFRKILFWLFILACLLLLWAVVEKSSQQRRSAAPGQTAPIGPAPSDETSSDQSGTNAPVAAARHANITHALLVNVGPFALLICVWLFLLTRLGPMAVRRVYRKDPLMQGEFTANITPRSISLKNTAGTDFTSVWNVYEYWREAKDVIIVVFRSGGYSTLSLAGLSEPQRNELRGILSTALPRR